MSQPSSDPLLDPPPGTAASTIALLPGTGIDPAAHATSLVTDHPPIADSPALSALEQRAEADAPQPLARRLASLIGLDAAILFTVLARGWSALSGLLTLTLIARFLSPTEQGYYYTFYPLVNSRSSSSSASRLSSCRPPARGRTPHAPSQRRHRRRSHPRPPPRLHARQGPPLVFRGGLAPARRASARRPPLLFHPQLPHPHQLASPWAVAAIATTFTFCIDPLFSFLEGCGQVREVARARPRPGRHRLSPRLDRPRPPPRPLRPGAHHRWSGSGRHRLSAHPPPAAPNAAPSARPIRGPHLLAHRYLALPVAHGHLLGLRVLHLSALHARPLRPLGSRRSRPHGHDAQHRRRPPPSPSPG